jgi:hypothetical protein
LRSAKSAKKRGVDRPRIRRPGKLGCADTETARATLAAVLLGLVAFRKQLAGLLRELGTGIAKIPAPLACLAATIPAVVAGMGVFPRRSAPLAS